MVVSAARDATPLHRRQHPHHHQQQVGGAAEREDDAPSLKYVDQPHKLSSEHFGGLYLSGLEERLGGVDDVRHDDRSSNYDSPCDADDSAPVVRTRLFWRRLGVV